jgi:hypothetical protein
VNGVVSGGSTSVLPASVGIVDLTRRRSELLWLEHLCFSCRGQPQEIKKRGTRIWQSAAIATFQVWMREFTQ